MIRCAGSDASSLTFCPATVDNTLASFLPSQVSTPSTEAAMASFPLRTGLAITLVLGLLIVAPLDALARGSGGRSSGHPSRSYSSGHTYRSPAASSRGSSKCVTCERDSHGRIIHRETYRSHYTLWNGRIEIGL